MFAIVVWFLLLSLIADSAQPSQLRFSPQDLEIEVGSTDYFHVIWEHGVENIKVYLYLQHDGVVNITPSEVTILESQSTYNVTVLGISPGHVDVYSNASKNSKNDGEFIRITVEHSYALNVFSMVIGWLYFLAWSISFYPQMYENWRRKSVIGLNFDFLALNLLGFFLYSLFNVGLYSIPDIVDEYQDRHPRGVNPVQINDIFFSVHAFVAVIFTIVQCYIYERGDQTVSKFANSLFVIYFLFLGISLVLAGTEVIHWLDFLYYCSYVKLSITLIKYVPQAYMNFQRKSTAGWSIGNILLDFTGGTLSMLQMIINSYNFNDWESIFGDPTKFGLGLFSVVFDIFFMVQHYCLYTDREDIP